MLQTRILGKDWLGTEKHLYEWGWSQHDCPTWPHEVASLWSFLLLLLCNLDSVVGRYWDQLRNRGDTALWAKNKYICKAFSQLSLSELCQSMRGNIGDFTYRPNKTQREEGNMTDKWQNSNWNVCVCLKFYCILSLGKEQYKRILEYFFWSSKSSTLNVKS